MPNQRFTQGQFGYSADQLNEMNRNDPEFVNSILQNNKALAAQPFIHMTLMSGEWGYTGDRVKGGYKPCTLSNAVTYPGRGD